jgi:hypothetical protein
MRIVFSTHLAVLITVNHSCYAPQMEINDCLGINTHMHEFIAGNFIKIDSLSENPFEPLSVNYKCINKNITISGLHHFVGFAYIINEGFAFYLLVPDNGKIPSIMKTNYGIPRSIGNLSIEQNSSIFFIWSWKKYNVYLRKYYYSYPNLPKEGCYSIIITNLKMRELGPQVKLN